MHDNWLSKRIQHSRSHQEKIWKEGINDLTIYSRPSSREIMTPSGEIFVDFMSCSYLGLDTHPDLIAAVKSSVDQYGVQYSAARTRAKCEVFDLLEDKVNQIFMNSHSVIFNSVGTSHLAVLPILGSGELPGYPVEPNGIVWIVDRTAHASIQVLRGILEQFGEYVRVSFQDEEAVSRELIASKDKHKTPVLVSDSLGSMGGAVHVEALLELARQYDGIFYVDDAHGTSIVGQHGCGYVLDKIGKFEPNLILASSLSKAFGSHGGSISFHNQEAASFVKKYALNYIFSGPPSIPGIAACLASANIHLSDEISILQNKLRDNIFYFDEVVSNVEVKEKSSPIRTIFIGSEETAIYVSKGLREKGILATAAMYPTVAQNQSIIRVAISAAHSAEHIKRFSEEIARLTNDTAN